jgi:serine protease
MRDVYHRVEGYWMDIVRTGLRGLAVVAAIMLLIGIAGAGTAASDTSSLTNPKHFFWAAGQNPTASTTTDSLTNDLIYHGGNAGPGAIGVEQKPAVYLVWWGPQWAQGFTTEDTSGAMYSSKTLQSYLESFFQNVGGSPWANIQTQYCAYAPVGSTSCVGGGGFVTNPKGQLKGVWTDSNPVPDDIITLGLAQNLVDDPIAGEAVRAVQHFGWNPNATYIILTPPTAIATGEPVYCGYHTQTTSVDGLGNPERIQYAFIPWLNENWPGLGEECGMHNVNATSDAFGNGIFDGYSIVTGHEYAEAVTDPDNFSSVQDGWNDDQTSENGDKCAWTNTQNIALGGHQFAVQPLWSNKAFDATGSGCVVAGP